ncbi:MAG TPA: amino acid ABC transporter permease [Egibacteraceae bacterium]|nr:amino acid ABC transporter permease [Egibacteraceae bacterium]
MERLLEGFFSLEYMARAFPGLLREGLVNTIILSFGAMALGLVGGMVLALLAISRRWWVRLPAKVYIDIFRGLPAILTIVLIGIGVPTAGFRPFGRNTYAYAILALGMIATAYIAEIYRAGIQSVDKGQMEAARSVGMPYLMAMRIIVIPQGVRRVFPPLTNEFIALIKDSSLVFVLGLSIGSRELFRVGQGIVQNTGNYSPLVMAGLFYLSITVPLTHLVNLLDERLRKGKPVVAEELPTGVDAPRRA